MTQVPPDFPLERFFAKHEFTAPYLMCCSDCETLKVREILDLEEGSHEQFLDIQLHYTESLGNPDLRKIIAEKNYETITADEILIDAGAAGILYSIFRCLLGHQDHIIVQFPCYTSLTDLAISFGVQVSLWEGKLENGWELDISDLDKLKQENTKMVVLNSPQNPTGFLFSKENFLEVIKKCKENDWIFVSDEVYRGLEDDQSLKLPAACDLYNKAISVGVMSKSLGLAGVRLGWLATKSKDIYDKIVSFKDYTTLCTAAPSEFLSIIAIRHQEKIINRNKSIVQSNKVLFQEFVNEYSQLFQWVCPSAGPIGFVKVNVPCIDEFCETVIKECGVLLAPSSAFHYNQPFFRVGLGRINFPQVLKVLDEYLEKKYKQ